MRTVEGDPSKMCACDTEMRGSLPNHVKLLVVTRRDRRLNVAEVRGSCDDRFSMVRDTLAANLDAGEDVGASVAVFLDGEDYVGVKPVAEDFADFVEAGFNFFADGGSYFVVSAGVFHVH